MLRHQSPMEARYIEVVGVENAQYVPLRQERMEILRELDERGKGRQVEIERLGLGPIFSDLMYAVLDEQDVAAVTLKVNRDGPDAELESTIQGAERVLEALDSRDVTMAIRLMQVLIFQGLDRTLHLRSLNNRNDLDTMLTGGISAETRGFMQSSLTRLEERVVKRICQYDVLKKEAH
jgi:hypothetical protein